MMNKLMASRWTHRTFLTIVIAGASYMFWCVAGVTEQLNAWNAWNQPKIASDLMRCCAVGLVVVGAAGGLDVRNLLRGFGVSIGPAPVEPPTQKETV